MNHIEAECDNSWQPPVPAGPRLEQADQQGCEEGKQTEGRNWLALVRGNKGMNGESEGTGSNHSPFNPFGGRAT